MIGSKTRGISLLEVLISLAVITVILLISLRYYQSVRDNQQVSTALGMLSDIVSAETEYAVDKNGVYATGANALSDLINGGYLPASFGGASTSTPPANPWGGGIVINGLVAGTATFSVQFSDSYLPMVQCRILDAQVQNINYIGSTSGCNPSPQNPSAVYQYQVNFITPDGA